MFGHKADSSKDLRRLLAIGRRAIVGELHLQRVLAWFSNLLANAIGPNTHRSNKRPKSLRNLLPL